jgi:hypothetical protein
MNHSFQEPSISENKNPILYENNIQSNLRYVSLEIDEEYILQEQKKREYIKNIKAMIICIISIIIFVLIIILFMNHDDLYISS